MYWATRQVSHATERALVGQALCSAIDNEPDTRNLGVIAMSHGVADVIRKPLAPDEPYLICSAGPNVHTAAPQSPGMLYWRAPPVGPAGNDLAKIMHWKSSTKPAPDLAKIMGWRQSDAPLSAETKSDLASMAFDVVVLGIGIALVAATGGVGAVGVWGVVQLATGALVVGNDAARVHSDIHDHGWLDNQEDNPNSKYSGFYKGVAVGALVVQFADGKAVAELGKSAIAGFRGAGKSSISALDVAKIVAPWKDYMEASKGLSDSKLGIGDALSGKIGPGQRVKLGKLFDIGGRKAKINSIRTLLALKLANDFGASTISLGLATYDGPLNELYTDVAGFQFSLLFPNDVNECRIGTDNAYDRSYSSRK